MYTCTRMEPAAIKRETADCYYYNRSTKLLRWVPIRLTI
jgi:hypothetical protein